MINIIRYRYWYFLFSLIIIIPGTAFLLAGGLKAGIDFTGGTELTLRFPTLTQNATLEKSIRDAVIQNAKIKEVSVVPVTALTRVGSESNKGAQYLVRISYIGDDNQKLAAIQAPLYQQYGCGKLVTKTATGAYKTPLAKCQQVVLDQSVNVGPTIGNQIRQRAGLAVVIAAVFILLYISFAFRKVAHPLRYGACAIVSLLHDVLVVLGLFAILGRLFDITVDSLFITAVLTVIGFSVHDTIVIFDRIRENMSRRIGEPFELVVNNAILQSMARSLNTSLTVILTLTALLIFGGASIRIFVLTLLIGITSGTYSSIFNASPLLVVWENDEWGIGRFIRRLRGKSTEPASRTRGTAAKA